MTRRERCMACGSRGQLWHWRNDLMLCRRCIKSHERFFRSRDAETIAALMVWASKRGRIGALREQRQKERSR